MKFGTFLYQESIGIMSAWEREAWGVSFRWKEKFSVDMLSFDMWDIGLEMVDELLDDTWELKVKIWAAIAQIWKMSTRGGVWREEWPGSNPEELPTGSVWAKTETRLNQVWETAGRTEPERNEPLRQGGAEHCQRADWTQPLPYLQFWWTVTLQNQPQCQRSGRSPFFHSSSFFLSFLRFICFWLERQI